MIVVGLVSQAGLLIAAFALLVIIFGEIPIQDALLTRHTPDHLRSRIFGLKFALALGASALAVPCIAALHAPGGGFIWLFGMLAACALAVGFAAIWLPVRPRHLDAGAAAGKRRKLSVAASSRMRACIAEAPTTVTPSIRSSSV